MKAFVLTLLLVLQLLLPSVAKESHKFLAVFCMIGEEEEELWTKHHPDVLWQTDSYATFPMFLELVKERAGEREIDLDLDMHGNDWGLALQASNNTEETECSFGYLLNEIDKHLNPKHVTVISEACYAGRAFKNTLTNNPSICGKYYQDHKGLPKYKVYGVGSATPNYGNMVFLQYRSKSHIYFEDISKYGRDDVPLAKKAEDWDNNPLSMWMFLLFMALWETVN